MEWNQVKAVKAGGAPGRRWAGRVVPFAAAAVLYGVGHLRAALAVAAVGLVVNVAALVGGRVWAVVDGALGAFSRAAGWVFTVVPLGAFYWLVLTPLGWFRRLGGHDALGRPDATAKSYWAAIRSGPPELISRQFSLDLPSGPPVRKARAALRVGGLALKALLTLAVLNFVIALMLPPLHPSMFDKDIAPGAKGLPWFEEYFREHEKGLAAFEYVSFLLWRHVDLSGKYINVRNNLRQGYEAKTAAAGSGKPVEIYFFGGSTMFGEGARDEHTIPSEVVRLAEARGLNVRAVNYGESGWTSWQEALQFTQLLAAGQKPDVAVFYDGFNDVFAQIFEPSERAPVDIKYGHLYRIMKKPDDLWHALNSRWYSALGYYAYWRASDPKRPFLIELPEPPQVLAPKIAKWHRASTGLEFDYGGLHGVKVFGFWQPNIHTKRLTPEELAWRAGYAVDQRPLFEAIRPLLDPRVTYIGDALDEVEGPVMLDEVHVNEAGNAAVAWAIFARIEPSLRAAAAAKDAP